MHSRLAAILKEKRREVDRLKELAPMWRADEIPAKRNFKSAISVAGKISVIAEIKFASPSSGVIREKTDPLPIARLYEEAGAAALSFITDRTFFAGDLHQLPRVKRSISLPVLRKDFVIHELQIKESVLHGADAVLLIARILSKERLRGLLLYCRECGLDPLTEVHDREDVEKAIDCGADIIGINNRDLDTFEVNLQTTAELAPLVPKNCIVVCESGIGDGPDIQALKPSGIQAVLVGSSLMKSGDMGKKTRELVEAGDAGEG
jgi:indole-3-glycerol phosphate synthase